MEAEQPRCLMMAGPNGAGKSTCASAFLPSSMLYINADEIAKTLGGQQTRDVEIQAARIALQWMDLAETHRQSFATETTLASKTLASRAIRLKKLGYHLHLIYFWTPSPNFSIRRVAHRVRLGGHDIPEDTIQRRWRASLKNFFALYQSIADAWYFVDNFTSNTPRLLASGRFAETGEIHDPSLWDDMKRRANDPIESDTAVQGPRVAEGLAMLELMKLGVDQALRNHQDRDVSIITWDRSAERIVEVPAAQIPWWIEASNHLS